MLKFKYPMFACAISDLMNVTDEQLEEWKKELDECSEHNREIRVQMAECRNDFTDNAVMIWGKDSKEVKYIKNMEIPWSHMREFDYYKSKVIKAREDESYKITIEDEASKMDYLIEKAINWLMERGKVLGTDYTIRTALKMANSIAFKEEVAGRQEDIEKTGLLVSFGGDDSCENCDGWDGLDNGCQCGNRRCYWEGDVYGDFFLNPIIYGQAY